MCSITVLRIFSFMLHNILMYTVTAQSFNRLTKIQKTWRQKTSTNRQLSCSDQHYKCFVFPFECVCVVGWGGCGRGSGSGSVLSLGLLGLGLGHGLGADVFREILTAIGL